MPKDRPVITGCSFVPEPDGESSKPAQNPMEKETNRIVEQRDNDARKLMMVLSLSGCYMS